ncbi:MAG: hypothetical protein AAGA11_16950 [Pseudomonadota bacterium]
MLYAVGQATARSADESVAACLQCVAVRRRSVEDVHWLKENAELLRVLCATRTPVAEAALDSYTTVYGDLPSRLQFFPQYYRFILSICRDLEQLGLPGRLAGQLQRYAKHRQFIEGELSDLQRLEALWLLDAIDGRRGPQQALLDRLHQFGSNAAFFAVPNRKAAFELTHLVFYLSRYGQHAETWFEDVVPGLLNVGMVALLDRDHDLLAEAVVALQYCGVSAPLYWQQVIAGAQAGLSAQPALDGGGVRDCYHEVITLGWAQSLDAGHLVLPAVGEGDVVFTRAAHAASPSPLRELSVALWRSGDRRSASWEACVADADLALSDPTRAAVHAVRASCDAFPAFFEHFARAVSVVQRG